MAGSRCTTWCSLSPQRFTTGVGATRAVLASALLAVACGRIEYQPRLAVADADAIDDGSAGDLDAAAPPDAPLPATGPVEVTAQFDGVPYPGQLVLFHDAAGALIGETATDAGGTASGTIPRDAMVTTAVTIPGRVLLTTIVGVQPLEAVFLQTAPQVDTLALNIGIASLPGASLYRISLPCGELVRTNGGTGPVPYRSTCARMATMDVIATAFDASSTAIAYSIVRDLPTDFGDAVDMPAWQALPDVVDGSISGVDASFDAMLIAAMPIVDGLSRSTLRLQRRHDLVAGSASGSVAIDAALAPEWLYVLEAIAPPLGSGVRASAEVRRGGYPPGALVPSAPFLPRIETAASTMIADRVEVTLDAPLDPRADAVAARTVWQTEGGIVSWEVIASPATRRLRSPELPASIASRALGEPAITQIEIVDASRARDWDDLRRSFGMNVYDPAMPLLVAPEDRLRISAVEVL